MIEALDHLTTKDIQGVGIITPLHAEAQLIKCMNCETPKPRKAFYQGKTGRASPYCIDCNTTAALKAKYRREIKREGVRGFTKRIKKKEYQLDLMLKAVVEFQKYSEVQG